MEYKDIEKLVNEAETLYQNTQEGYVQDSDTILKDLVDEAYDGDLLDCHLKFSRPGKLLKMTLRENWWRRCLCISLGGSLRNILKNV